MNLRFIERDGKKILQWCYPQEMGIKQSTGVPVDWYDVPLVQEPKKPREFWLYHYDGSKGKVYLATDNLDLVHRDHLHTLTKVREVLDEK